MILVINTSGRQLIDNVWVDKSSNYKITDCPELTQAQQAAMIARLTPWIEQHNDDVDMPIVGWSLEADNYVSPTEQAWNEANPGSSYTEPSIAYLEAIVWDGTDFNH